MKKIAFVVLVVGFVLGLAVTSVLYMVPPEGTETECEYALSDLYDLSAGIYVHDIMKNRFQRFFYDMWVGQDEPRFTAVREGCSGDKMYEMLGSYPNPLVEVLRGEGGFGRTDPVEMCCSRNVFWGWRDCGDVFVPQSKFPESYRGHKEAWIRLREEARLKLERFIEQEVLFQLSTCPNARDLVAPEFEREVEKIFRE